MMAPETPSALPLKSAAVVVAFMVMVTACVSPKLMAASAPALLFNSRQQPPTPATSAPTVPRPANPQHPHQSVHRRSPDMAPVTNPTERRPVSRSTEIENAYTTDKSSRAKVQAVHIQPTYRTSSAINFAPSTPKRFSDTSSSVIVRTCTTSTGDTQSARVSRVTFRRSRLGIRAHEPLVEFVPSPASGRAPQRCKHEVGTGSVSPRKRRLALTRSFSRRRARAACSIEAPPDLNYVANSNVSV